jgi:dTDP-4-dehydrorhamnose reductase
MREVAGVYHVAGSGGASRYELVRELVAMLPAAELVIEPVHSDEFPTVAPRPMDTRLNCERAARTFGVVMKPWREDLAAFVRQMTAR